MAKQSFEFQVTVPAGTNTATPITQDISFPSMEVESIKWRMPTGHAGLVGWALTDAGSNIIPSTPGQWIIGDKDAGNLSVSGLPDSGGFQVTAYNLGNYPHTIYLTFNCNPVRDKHAARLLMSRLTLNSAPDLSRAGPPVGSES